MSIHMLYSVENILKVSDIDSLVKLDTEEVYISPTDVEILKNVWIKIKRGRYENALALEKRVSVELCSESPGLTDKLADNIRRFFVFSPLLKAIQDRKKKDHTTKISSWIGSGLRSVGGMLRGDSTQQQKEFTSLTDAMDTFEKIYQVDENGIYKVGMGNILRGLGESFSGESCTFQRVIKRTVEGLNPFLKHVSHNSPNVKEEFEHVICVSHVLLRLFHHRNEPIAAKHFTDYLFSYVFPRFGLFRTKVTVQTTQLPQGEEDDIKLNQQVDDFDPSVYDRSFFRGVGRFVFYDYIHKREFGISGSGNIRMTQVVELQEYLKECLKVSELYLKFFKFRHFSEDCIEAKDDDEQNEEKEHPQEQQQEKKEKEEEVEGELDDDPNEDERKEELQKIFEFVYERNISELKSLKLKENGSKNEEL